MNARKICAAKNRKGKPCARRPMKNGRCHLHGGKSPGPPKGNQNALKHGFYSRAAIDQRARVRLMMKASERLHALVLTAE